MDRLVVAIAKPQNLGIGSKPIRQLVQSRSTCEKGQARVREYFDCGRTRGAGTQQREVAVSLIAWRLMRSWWAAFTNGPSFVVEKLFFKPEGQYISRALAWAPAPKPHLPTVQSLNNEKRAVLAAVCHSQILFGTGRKKKCTRLFPWEREGGLINEEFCHFFLLRFDGWKCGFQS